MKAIMTLAALAVALCGCGAPKPRPVFEPPPAKNARAPQDVHGWWVSASVSGPNSAGVRRIEMIFNSDGSYEGTAVVEEKGALRVRSTAGRFSIGDSALTIDYAAGHSKTYGFRWDGGDLVLKDGEAEIRLRAAP